MAEPPSTPFINRELSWLEFNQRVLDEALAADAPLLERLKFLAITASNLDEFFMVRVGGLELLRAEGSAERDPAGLDAGQQLEAIGRRAAQMVRDQYRLYAETLEPALAAEGLRRFGAKDLTAPLYEHAAGVFEREIYPVLSPVAARPGTEPPDLEGRWIHLAVRLAAEQEGGRARFAFVPLPRRLSRFVTLPIEAGHNYILLEDLVAEFVQRLFPGEAIQECRPFRLTRNADMAVEEDEGGDLLDLMKGVLLARRSGGCVRLEVAADMSKTLLGFLRETFGAGEASVYAVPGPLDLSAFLSLARLAGFDRLRDKPWIPQAPPDLDPSGSMFDAIRRRDILLVHPYDSFDPVVRLVEEAAADPGVLAIKQILYRTSENSPVVAALARAAQREKHVTALVELKARFDEARNIGWAEALEQSGVQVIWGLKGLKTHAKILIIVRREPDGLRRYVHFGTGNYNEITARLYSDVSYFTCQEDFGADATAFFNTITGYSQPVHFRRIEAAPIGLRARIEGLIEGEMQRAQQGQEARILAKVNTLVDTRIAERLYQASQAGVKIQLNVRGACCLRPGVKGLSENIRVVSIVDRFLEHARILCFHHGGEPLVFISSADWMSRNLDRRVELLVPVDDPAARDRLIRVLETCLKDNVKGRVLQADGSYVRPKAPSAAQAVRAQEIFHREAYEAVKQARTAAPVVFEPQQRGGT